MLPWRDAVGSKKCSKIPQLWFKAQLCYLLAVWLCAGLNWELSESRSSQFRCRVSQPELGFTIITNKDYPNGIIIITIKVVIME